MMQPVKQRSSVALVVGATGMVGLSLAQSLKTPTCLGSPWKVIGAARRPVPTWFPPSLLDNYIALDATRADDTRRHLSPVSGEVTHLFWLAVQRLPDEATNEVVNCAMLRNVVDALTSDPASPLAHITLLSGTKHYMGPIFDPTHSARIDPRQTPFREDAGRVPAPNYYYALEDLLASYAPAFTYSVHRSSIIFGASSRSEHNAVLTIAAYALICQHEGRKFRFPGTRYTWEHFCDASDSRVLARQQIWAATTARCENEAFNCTNGDVFSWKALWAAFSEALGVELAAFEDGEEVDLVESMKEKGKVWEEIVEKHGLEKTKLEDIACFDAMKTVLNFDFQHVSSTYKSREFGFFEFVDTLKSVSFWVHKLRDMNIIPK